MGIPDRSVLARVVTHPAIWALPVMVLLVWASMPFNEGFYEQLVNYDPQGEAQMAEYRRTREIFMETSGALGGQFLAATVGVLLSRRYQHGPALVQAVVLGVLMAGIPFALNGPAHVGLSAAVLGAFPLFAAAGVGAGVLTAGMPVHRRRPLLAVVTGVWLILATIGLFQDDGYTVPQVFLAFPPFAASAAITLAGLSMDVWLGPSYEGPGELRGDGGHGARIALLTGIFAYALILNLIAARQSRRLSSPRV